MDTFEQYTYIINSPIYVIGPFNILKYVVVLTHFKLCYSEGVCVEVCYIPPC